MSPLLYPFMCVLFSPYLPLFSRAPLLAIVDMDQTRGTTSKKSIDHLPLQPQCGACGDKILRHERVIALSGNEDSTACVGQTRPFPFPQPGMAPTLVDDRLLCRRPDCHRCAAAPKFIPVHYDCYCIFRETSRKVLQLEEHQVRDQLWTVGAWRSPWLKAQLIYLTERAVDRYALKILATESCFPRLCDLPLEIISMIRNLSCHELLWRSVSVISIASKKPELQLTKIPLNEILSRERRGHLVRSSSSPLPPLIRLTIDNHGICKLERLAKRPIWDGNITQDLAFIVEHGRDISHVDAEIKDGLLRLCIPRYSETKLKRTKIHFHSQS